MTDNEIEIIEKVLNGVKNGELPSLELYDEFLGVADPGVMVEFKVYIEEHIPSEQYESWLDSANEMLFGRLHKFSKEQTEVDPSKWLEEKFEFLYDCTKEALDNIEGPKERDELREEMAALFKIHADRLK